MRVARSLVTLLGTVSLTGAVDSFGRRSDDALKEYSDATPRRYIVEFKSRSHSSRAAARVQIIPGLQVVKHFDSDIFPGLSIECDHDCSAESVTAAVDDGDEDGGPTVASVFKSSLVRLLPTLAGDSFSDDAAAANYSVHALTGVEELHQAGILGSGAVVAIVDSGVQYTHPALGGGIGPNFTVAGGYDLVGDNWPDAPATPDDDPMDIYGHGTHVAGIIVGKSEQFVGVAPEAKLLVFKTFGSGGYSNEETIIEGFLKAFDSGADIISASVGEDAGFSDNAWAEVASRMVDQGVVVVIAAGNSGQDGPFDASNGASGRNVLTIAAADPGVLPAQAFSAKFNLGGTTNESSVAYIPGTSGFFPSTILDWPVLAVSLNTTSTTDACSPLPSGVNFTGTIALARIGSCGMTTQHTNLLAAGAQYILFYNNDAPYQAASSGNRAGFIAAIEADAGKAIVETISAGGNVTASFNVDTANYVGLYNSGGGRPAAYTSWGSTFDLFLKPDVAAPGTKILSTYPTDGYRVLSGTSMATPYMAGVAALWVSQFGGRAAHADDPAWAKRLISRISSTARAVPWADWSTSPKDYGFWAPTTQVGAGLVNAVSVLGYTTELSFEGRKFELNDTVHFVGEHSVEITNRGPEPVSYTFALQDAGGYEPWNPEVPGQSQSFIPALQLYPDLVPVKITPGVTFPQGEFIVGPGETRQADFKFSLPTGMNEARLPVYTGKILISGSNGEELGIPYFGVGSELRTTVSSIWDRGAGYPILVSGVNSWRLDMKSNFTFNLTRSSQDFPRLNTMFTWGAKELRWDIYDANYTEADWSYPPVVGEHGYIGSATSWSHAEETSFFDPELNSEDDIFSLPVFGKARGKWNQYWWLGRYADGSTVQPGEYRFRIAILRPFGERENAEDWDVWTTPLITVLPQ